MISLIAGKYKGKKLHHFKNKYVRPTQAKVRKSIFQILEPFEPKLLSENSYLKRCLSYGQFPDFSTLTWEYGDKVADLNNGYLLTTILSIVFFISLYFTVYPDTEVGGI